MLTWYFDMINLDTQIKKKLLTFHPQEQKQESENSVCEGVFLMARKYTASFQEASGINIREAVTYFLQHGALCL